MSLKQVTALIFAVALTASTSAFAGNAPYTGPWFVFFSRDSATLDLDASKELDRVLVAADNVGATRIMLQGRIQQSEEETVAMRRVAAVREYLLAHGIRDNSFSIDLVGSQNPFSVTSFDGKPSNQSVVLFFLPDDQSMP